MNPAVSLFLIRAGAKLAPFKWLILAVLFAAWSAFVAKQGYNFANYQNERRQIKAKADQQDKVDAVVDKSIVSADKAKASGAAHKADVAKIVQGYETDQERKPADNCRPTSTYVDQPTVDAINAIIDRTNQDIAHKGD